MLAALLCPILFSISAVCGHRSSKLIGGTEANFWRLTFATFFLGLWAYGFGKGLAGTAFPMFCLSGVVGIGLGDVALFQALPRLGSRLSMLLVQCLTAPFGALLEWVWLGTSLGLGQVLCGLLVLFGVGVALNPGKHLKLSPGQLCVGVMFSVISACGGAGGAVLSRKAYFVMRQAGEHIDPINAGFQRVIGGALLAAVFLLLLRWRSHRLIPSGSLASAPKLTKDKWRGLWPWVLGNSLAGQTLGVSAMQRALETTPAWVVLAIIATTPVVVIPFAFLSEGERPNARSVLGGMVAVAGVVGLAWLKHN